MTSNPAFSQSTFGSEVTAAFPAQIRDKIILITGVSAGGIGGSTAWSLANQKPKLLILTGRQESRVEEVINRIRKDNADVPVKFLQLDLASQQSVRKAAEKVLNDKDVPHINLLINNAGVMNIPELTYSPEKIETQFATNHIGHFLFTNLLMPKLQAAAAASPKGATRVINVSSRAITYGPVRFSDHNFTKFQKDLPESERPNWDALAFWNLTEASSPTPYLGPIAYGQSKSANVLFSRGLTKRVYDKYGILSIGLHPGFIMTELARHMDPKIMEEGMKKFKGMLYAKNLEEGCSTSLVAALDPKLGPEAELMSDCQVVAGEGSWAPKWATDAGMAEKLWTLSEQLTKTKFTY